MNITLSIDEKIAAQARISAQAMGKSLNQAVRDYLEQLAGRQGADATEDELRLTSGQGNSGGEKFDRESLYAERLDRYRGA